MTLSFSAVTNGKKLKRLIVDKVKEESGNYTHKCDAVVSLNEVKFHVSGEGIFNKNCRIQWRYLVKIEMACTYKEIISTLTSIAESDNFPLLETVCIEICLGVDMRKVEMTDQNLEERLKQKLPPAVVDQAIDSLLLSDKYKPYNFMASFMAYMSLDEEFFINSKVNDMVC